MNMAELSAMVKAMSNELVAAEDHFRELVAKINSLHEEIDRLKNNTDVDSCELRQRIRALEIGR